MSSAQRFKVDRIRALASLHNRCLLSKGAWGLGDHALMSATNFLTMILVARGLTPKEFGLFTLAYTGLLFANSIQSALILQPYTVLGATRAGDDFARYTMNTGLMQLAQAVLTAFVTLCLAGMAFISEWWIAPVILALVPATMAWQLQEFIRRSLYVQSSVSSAFVNDIITYGGQLVLIMTLWRTDRLGPASAILALAVTSLAGFLFGMWQIRNSIDMRFARGEFAADIRANWNFGKWLLGGNLAFWTSVQIYPVLAAGILNVTAAGALRAIQTLFGPLNILNISLEPMFGPQAAREYAAGGTPQIRRFMTRIQLGFALLVGSYCLLVAIFAEPILRIAYGQDYVEFWWLLMIVAGVNFASSMRGPLLLALKAIASTSIVFRINVISSAMNLSLGVGLVQYLGLPGVAIGMVCNGILIHFLIWHYYRKLLPKTALA